jgi:tetratricopeptide (TPR) repeat protein
MWSRLSNNAGQSLAGVGLAALLASACHAEPPVKEAPPPQSATVAAAAAPAAPAVPAAPPPQALADFDRAVGLMRAGNESLAEAQFHELALAYPSFAGPDINLGILYRKAGRLEESERALKAATTRDAASATAWNELGVTLRLRGEFPEAAAAYEHAIAADANFAPAHRNLGVVLDLYLGDPERALTEFERYQELSREEKPVSVWIAELGQRTGQKKPASSPPATPPATPATPSGESL